MIVLVFWFSLFLIFFAYLGYPITLGIISLFSKKQVDKQPDFIPNATLIITVHNEEKRIEKKLLNTLALEYPTKNLQIIVASDASTDGTNDIVKKYENENIRLLEVSAREGKENAQREAVAIATGDILIFSDVATIIEPHGLKEIVSNFSDASIGCVSSDDRLIGNDDSPSGEGLYVKYEMWLRRLESTVNSLVGLSGSYFAARTDVCKDFSREMQSDFRTLLNTVKLGMRGISDPKVIGFYQDIADEKMEFQRKVRTVLRGLTVYFNNLEYLNVFKYGMFSYQYFCHKLLRWLVPGFLILTFITNFILSLHNPLYLLIFISQIIFYIYGIIGMKDIVKFKIRLFKIPMYFITVNYSILIAWIKYFSGEKIVFWQPSNR